MRRHFKIRILSSGTKNNIENRKMTTNYSRKVRKINVHRKRRGFEIASLILAPKRVRYKLLNLFLQISKAIVSFEHVILKKFAFAKASFLYSTVPE